MANNASKYLEDARVNWIRGTTYPTVPANFYIALLTTMPTAQDGTGAVEVTGGAYARQAVASGTAQWNAVTTSGTAEQTKNTNQISFTQATANWGTILGIGIYDASSGGNLLWFGTLTSSQTVNSGFTFVIAAGNLVIQED